MVITVVRKPFKGSVCENIEGFSCSGINIKLCRLPTKAHSFIDKGRVAKGTSLNWSKKKVNGEPKIRKETIYDGSLGRWPANVIISNEVSIVMDNQSDTSEYFMIIKEMK